MSTWLLLFGGGGGGRAGSSSSIFLSILSQGDRKMPEKPILQNVNT